MKLSLPKLIFLRNQELLSSLAFTKTMMNERLPCAKRKMSKVAIATNKNDNFLHMVDSCCINPSWKEPRVVIVGAGMAGLSAAHRLTQCGIRNFIVLESKDRPGGRILTNWYGDTVIEMGADYIHGACLPNLVYSLASQDKLLQSPMPRIDDTKGLFCTSDGRPIDLPLTMIAYHTFRQIEQQAVNLFRLGHEYLEGTLLNFIGLRIQQELHNFPEEQRYDAAKIMFGMCNLLRYKCGDDLSLVSAGQYGSFIEIPGGSVRIPQGYIAVISPLLRYLPENCIHYNKTVNVIRWAGEQTESGRTLIECCDGEKITADYVIITFSLGCLKCYAETMFKPVLPTCKMDAIRNLGYGLSNKIFLAYKNPFWLCNEGNLKFAWSVEELNQEEEDWTRGVCAINETPGSNRMLCAMISGQEAAQMEKVTDDDVAQGITRLLRKFTGNSNLPFPDMVKRTTWASDPQFCGSNSYMSTCSTVGHQCELGSPVPNDSPKLLFAGEATVPGYFATVHGARLSGIREAQRVTSLTQKYQGPPSKLRI